VEQHGGKVGVESEVDKGACFMFTLRLMKNGLIKVTGY
jgi:signal transduction histidine kinase